MIIYHELEIKITTLGIYSLLKVGSIKVIYWNHLNQNQFNVLVQHNLITS